MSIVPSDLLYTPDHLWVRVDGAEATIGITDYAQRALGEMDIVELPRVGDAVAAGREVFVIDCAKAAVGLDAPLSGTVVAVNDALTGQPELVRSGCYGAGWVFRLRLSDEAELNSLLAAEAYGRIVS